MRQGSRDLSDYRQRKNTFGRAGSGHGLPPRKMREKNILHQLQPLLDLSLSNQLVYTITQAAYRFDTYDNFKNFYNLLTIYDYPGMKMKTNISKFGKIKRLIYRLSLYPRIFFFCIKGAKSVGFKMI